MLTVFIVGAIICGYLAVALAAYILLLRFTDYYADDCVSMALFWPFLLVCVILAAVSSAIIWVFRAIERQIRGEEDKNG